MKCPRCTEAELLQVNKYGVIVDVCPSCGGMWLDRGELSKILEAIRRVENSFEQELRFMTRDNADIYRRYEEYKLRKRRKSIFEELLDIFD